MTDKGTHVDKVLTRTWENKVDCWSVLVCCLSSLVQVGLFISIVYAFMISRKAGLNIGVTTSIWATEPFLVALTERVFFRVSLGLYQIVGMVLIMTMVILISLSDLFGPAPKVERLDGIIE